MREIGSQEIPRAIQYSLDETAKWAVTHFGDEVMPAVLGDRRGESWSAAPGSRKLSTRTRNAISYDRSRKRSYDSVKESATSSPASISTPKMAAA